ncbi:MAG: GbsR/MarR family transcriptional regulator [Bacteroidia bacterium]
MEIKDAKQRLIEAWGALGTSWGVNRTMAQVHALLLIAPEALSAEDVMEQLNISRGNANMNLRALIDWGLARKVHKAGERREFFVAEKDMARVARQIIQERQKRELAPILQVLKEVKAIDDKEDPEERANFIESVERLDHIVSQANTFLEFIIKAETSWLASNMLKILTSFLENAKTPPEKKE